MTSSDSSSADFSSSSEGSEDLKMKAMLDEWDDNDGDSPAAVYEDSDSEAHDEATLAAKKKALLQKQQESEDEESEAEESEAEESEESEEEESEESEEEESEEEEDDEKEAEEESEEEEEEEDQAIVPVVSKATTDSENDDDDEVIDDGNIEDTLKKKPKKPKKKIEVKPITAVSEDDNEEDKAMKALLSNWGGDDDDDDDDDDSDDESEQSEREVVLDDNVIDHVVLAAPDLDAAMEDFEKMTGIKPVIAGSINGLGIKTARISFNDASYIEIIAPDPKQAGPIGQLLKSKNITELTPFHFAVRTSKCEELKDEVKDFGYVPDHITMFGGEKDGTPRKWELLFLYSHKLGGTCPYFVNWANSEHPCAKLPVVGKLKKFTVRAPEDDPVHELLEHVPVKGLNIETGKNKLSFQFSSPEGTVKFATTKAVGYKFPGFDDEEQGIDDAGDEDIDFSTPDAPELLDVNTDDYEALPPPSY